MATMLTGRFLSLWPFQLPVRQQGSVVVVVIVIVDLKKKKKGRGPLLESVLHSFRNVNKEEGGRKGEMALANAQKSWVCVSRSCFPSLSLIYGYLWRSLECALMSVEFLDWTSAVTALYIETLEECYWCWHVWVLLWVVFWGLFGPFLVPGRCCKISKSDFSTLCCKLFFDPNLWYCVFSVSFFFFFFVFSFSLLSQTWILSPLCVRACR